MEPVRDQPDVATADTRGHQHVDQPDTGGGHQRQVPKALHMRFQAELHQMESIEEAERQLNQLNRLRDVATARNEAVTAANYVQVQFFSVKSQHSFVKYCDFTKKFVNKEAVPPHVAFTCERAELC